MTRNDFKENISQALDEMKMEQGSSFDLSKVNLAELERRTGISRFKLRRLKRNDFVFKVHGNTDHKPDLTVLSGFEEHIDELLTHGVSNSNVCFERIKDLGYHGKIYAYAKNGRNKPFVDRVVSDLHLVYTF